mmetsp:Transcript_10858/g.15893  ORF Transcript_10858/g.15893 Transcript_10858/m.15893 type:complete len:103 (+) Transcript_10858:168-476(+)
MVARIEYFAFKDEIFTLLMKNAQDLFKRRKIVKSKFIQKQFEKYTSEIDCTTEYLGLWRPIDNPRPSEGVIGGAVFKQFSKDEISQQQHGLRYLFTRGARRV